MRHVKTLLNFDKRHHDLLIIAVVFIVTKLLALAVASVVLDMYDPTIMPDGKGFEPVSENLFASLFLCPFLLVRK